MTSMVTLEDLSLSEYFDIQATRWIRFDSKADFKQMVNRLKRTIQRRNLEQSWRKEFVWTGHIGY